MYSRRGMQTGTIDQSEASTQYDNSKIDHTFLVGSQQTIGVGSILQSVGTGFTESALGDSSILTPESMMQSTML